MPKQKPPSDEPLSQLPIFEIRGQRVILDTDLARIYGVETKKFNQAIKRNRDRFPADFAFQLTANECRNLKSQFVTSSLQISDNKDDTSNWSQIVTSSEFAAERSKHRGKTYLPWAFTEHGCLMAANVLRSERAVCMSVYVIRAFVQMREQLTANAEILKRLAEIDKTLLEHDQSLQIIWMKLQPLLAPPPVPAKKPIGFRNQLKTRH